jgi:hypothetical protein
MQKLSWFSPFFLLAACSDANLDVEKSDGGTPDAKDGGSACMCNPLDAMFTQVLSTSWSCYCSVADCSRTLSDYVGFADGGMVLKDRPLDSYRTNRTFRATEYADCNLVEVGVNDQDNYYDSWGNSTGKTFVFDQRTGQLVGAYDLRGDVGILCPFGPGYIFAAGTYPVPETCHASAAVVASLCSACGADELCVGYYDGTCKFLGKHCVQVSTATRDSILVKRESCFMKPTGKEICGSQDDCVLGGSDPSSPSCASGGEVWDVTCHRGLTGTDGSPPDTGGTTLGAGGVSGTGGTDGGQSSTDVPVSADAE